LYPFDNETETGFFRSRSVDVDFGSFEVYPISPRASCVPESIEAGTPGILSTRDFMIWRGSDRYEEYPPNYSAGVEMSENAVPVWRWQFLQLQIAVSKGAASDL
jgi:hypothetical protein